MKVKVYSYMIFLITFQLVAQKQLSNELIWTGSEFSTEYVYAVNSMNDGEHFTLLENNKINKYSYKNFGEPIATILDGKKLMHNNQKIVIEDYEFNADESKLLIATNIKSIYRRSYTADYYIFDLKTNKLKKLIDKDTPQQLADFSPDGSKVAFVMENNLYYLDLMANEIRAITNNGTKNEIINGGTDWVYEEEFEITKGFYWAPNSQKISFFQFNEKEVPEFTMFYYYGKTYPSPYTFKYPKAGEPNSKVSVWLYDVTKQNKTAVMKTGRNYEYFPRMKWTQNNTLCVLGMNRHQNRLDYILVDEKLKAPNNTKIIYTDSSKTYVEVDDNLIFLKDGQSFLRTSEKDGFNHIYKINFDGNETQLTKGQWDVVELKGVDDEKGLVYFISAEEGAMYKSLYVTDLKGKKKLKLSTLKGNNDADFSTGMKYYINYYTNANRPYLITLNNAKGKELQVLKNNNNLIQKLKTYQLTNKTFLKIKGATDSLNAWMIKPPNFDATKKYPVYFNIYNGPGHNTVSDAWDGRNYLYHQLLAQKGYIVISVDTRGTMYRGAEFKKSTYMKLGKLETEDMIAVAESISKWEFVDKDRIGVQGWSYGGYMTGLCMTKGASIFKMGIAVAPVTNWRWYDNIYTERFMRTPQENPSGYDDNSPINHVDKMKGKFLIIHGSGDDNVHVQNTLEMTKVMVEKNIDFDMVVYTNKNHGIYGGVTRLHLFNKMLKYTLENL
jgi:dipeptidyl-peptidase-4